MSAPRTSGTDGRRSRPPTRIGTAEQTPPESPPITHLVVGPAQHGVVQHALGLLSAEALGDHASIVLAEICGLAGHHGRVAGIEGLTHLHVTDRLFGNSPERAADAVEAIAARGAVSVTMHDLPQPSDGTGYRRRQRCYARIAACARGVIVASEHEADLLRAAFTASGLPGHLPDLPPVVVIPLPIDLDPIPEADRARLVAAAATPPRDVAVLGFLYPGKGHLPALVALADLPDDVGLLALGRPSPGHEDLVDDLRNRAAASGRRCLVTGYLPEAELRAQLRRVAVPVAPHEHVSASGSIGTWVAAGRRPIVPWSRYVAEVLGRCPESLQPYGPGSPAGSPAGLAEAVAWALDDPAGTWLPAGSLTGPTTAQVAARYDRVLGDWAAGRTRPT